jgi:hypothetical protein
MISRKSKQEFCRSSDYDRDRVRMHWTTQMKMKMRFKLILRFIWHAGHEMDSVSIL